MDQPSDRTPPRPATPSRRSFLKGAGALGLAAGMAGALGSPFVEAATRDAHAADDGNALVLWTFVDTHARWFKRRAAEYRKQVNHTFSLTVHQYPNPPYQQKLLTVLQTGIDAPDLADVEQGMFGAFLHGTVPFVPLEGRLKAGAISRSWSPRGKHSTPGRAISTASSMP